ncbi:MAG: YraN family protein [Thermodesulfobacteriota bacterium]
MPVDSAEDPRKSVGLQGEEIALRFLKDKGYKIVDKNVRTPVGEIDIIALDMDTISFIEVKTRTNSSFGPPQVSVDIKKQKKLSRLASLYLAKKGLSQKKARFDVVAVLLFPKQREKKIELIKDAFELKL